MRRKLIGQGVGGVTVTLPINWVRDFSLNPGSEVDVLETNEGILVQAVHSKKEKSITLDLREYDRRMILNFLNQSYRLGYDSIHITYKNEEQYSTITEITKNTLLGFEIVENKNYHCTLQNIAEPDVDKFEVILRKIFLQIMEMAEKIIEDFRKNVLSKQSIEEYKLQIDKLTNYTRRTIIRTKYGGNKSILLYSIISQLSLISHAYYYIYQYSIDKKKKLSSELLFCLIGITQMFRTYYEAFYAKDLKKLSQLSKLKDEFMAQNTTLLEKSTPSTAVFLSHMREIIRLTHMCMPFSLGYWLEDQEAK